MSHIFKISLLFICCTVISCNKTPYMPKFAVCCQLPSYPSVKAAGYDYIEPNVDNFLAPAKRDSVFSANLEEMKRLDAKIISCVVFLPGQLKVTGPETKHDDIIARAEITFSRAQKAGIPIIVFGSGGARRVPDGFGKKEATDQFIALCKRLGPVAQKYNVTVVVEPLNTGETNIINSLREGAEIVEAVNHPNIRLLCDIYHMLRENEPASEIVKYGKLIRHCHIAEKETRSAPGTKGDDFKEYFKALKEINYQGCLSIEGKWDDFETRLVPALQYMQEQFRSL